MLKNFHLKLNQHDLRSIPRKYEENRLDYRLDFVFFLNQLHLNLQKELNHIDYYRRSLKLLVILIFFDIFQQKYHFNVKQRNWHTFEIV